MPQTTRKTQIVLPGWSLGLNRDADPAQLSIEESPDALNVEFGLRGAVSKRAGYQEWDTTPTGVGRLMGTWKTLAGVNHIFHVDADGTIWNGTAAPLTDSTKDVGTASAPTEYPVAMTVFENIVYFTARNADPAASFDGASWSDITLTDFDGTASRFPAAAFLATHHQRVFAANVQNSSGTRSPSAVYWSEKDDPTDWESTEFIDFDPEGGSEITSMVQFGESLVVFTRNSVQLLTGKSPASFARYVLDSQLGTESPGTVVPVGGRLFFFDAQTGVHSFDGATFEQLDTPINQYILDGQAFGSRHKAFAFFFENRYFLSIPWGADDYPSRMFVYDLRNGAWTEWDYGVPAAVVVDGTIYGSAADNASTIFTLMDGTDDDGSAISSYFYTAWIVPDETPSVKNRAHRIDSVWTAYSSAPDVTLEVRRNYDTGAALYQQTFSLDSGGSLWGTMVWGTDVWGGNSDEVITRMRGLNSRWYALQLAVVCNGLSDQFQVNRMAMTTSALEGKRGGDPSV